MLLGEAPSNIERLWAKMYYGSLYWGRRGAAVSAISGIETALWDIAGKVHGVPVYQLLGGRYHDMLSVYAAIVGFPRDELESGLRDLVERGFNAIKLRIGVEHPAAELSSAPYDIERDREMIAAARATVGPGVALLVDAGQNETETPWPLETAIAVARMLEDFECYWLEDPCNDEDLDGWSSLAAEVDLPIVGGGAFSTRFAVHALLERKGVDIYQTDAVQLGGLLECKKVAALASARGIPITPHIWWTGVGMMANLHFAVSTPEVLITEYPVAFMPMREDLLVEPVAVERSQLRLPTTVGLGVQLSEEIEERYRFQSGPLWAREEAVVASR
jgi:L-alanine-DL-glutamate epimerase-like enolase superfamily enzyme